MQQVCENDSLTLLSGLLPVPNGGCFVCEWNSSYRCVQAGTLVKCLKFGAYRTMHTEVISISCFTARHSKWRSRHAHTVNPIRKILITSHVSRLKSVHTEFHDIPIKFVGGVRLNTSHVKFWSFPVARRGRYESGWISACEWLHGGTLIKHEKFHADWTMYSGVISIWFFLAKRSKWRPSHAHTVTPIQKILITFDPKGVKTLHSNFYEDPIKSLGGVR